MVTLTSLVGARRNSMRPTIGSRPDQLETRMSTKAPMKMGR